MHNKLMKSSVFFICVFCLCLMSCEDNNQYKSDLKNPDLFSSAVKDLQDVIVYDIFSPPVASRIYMYPTIASYSVIQKQYPDAFNSLAGQLNGLEELPSPNHKDINYELASLHAFYEISKLLIYSEEQLLNKRNKLYDSLRQRGLSDRTFTASVDYGTEVADHISKWAEKDFYKQSRSYPQ